MCNKPQTNSHLLSTLLVLFIFLSGCQSTLIQSPNDQRQYELLELPNKLSVLLISDSTAEKSAASVSVFRGSYSSPKNREGLAHFLEHMLFLGTEKYPDSDEYGNFISSHGGSNNAYTAQDHTNYFFDIQSEYLEGGLDRFAQFFISPNFDAEYVEREKNAVNSEYQLQLKDDGWRGQAVSRLLFNPKHPGSRFTIGSLDTLSGNVREDLLKFAKNNYSANQMALVVLGKQNLDTLRNWVSNYFSAIPNHDLPVWQDTEALFTPGSLPKLLKYQTMKSGYNLGFAFPVPSPTLHYQKKPGVFITNLIGHEGTGSLHEALKKRGWIENLSAGGNRLDNNTGLIQINITLTQSGKSHVSEIREMLFAYIALIKETGIERWRYEEQSLVANLGFQFQEKGSAQGYVSSLSPQFRLYPSKEVLVANYLMQNFDASLIESYLDALTPENMVTELTSPVIETDKMENWFKVPYSLETTPINQTDKEHDAAYFGLSLPEPNMFLPDALGLVSASAPLPRQMPAPNTGMEAWYAPDTEFRVPRANINIAIDTLDGNLSAADMVRARLHARLVNDRLNTLTYPARLAGLHFGISATSSGFEVSIGGYNQKQAVLLEAVLRELPLSGTNADKLALYQSELARNWDNFSSERPYAQTYATLRQLVNSASWPPAVLSSEIQTVSLTDLEKWVNKNLTKVSVRVLQHGNINALEAENILSIVQRNLNIADIERKEPNILPVTSSAALDVAVDHADSAMVAYIQSDTATFTSRAYYGLSAQLIRQAYYSKLRTEQQLGYVVTAIPAVMRTTPGLAFIIQSPSVSALELLQHTQNFLDNYSSVFQAMNEDDFETHKAALISRLVEKDKNLGGRTGRYWSDLDTGVLSFDSRQQIADEIARISKADYEIFFKKLLNDFKNKRLIIYSKGNFDAAPSEQHIESILEFKSA